MVDLFVVLLVIGVVCFSVVFLFVVGTIFEWIGDKIDQFIGWFTFGD